MSQFPLPVVHAHASDDLHLASHLQQKHPGPSADCDCLHWHLLMPWDVDGDHDQDEPKKPSPLGLWGVGENTLLVSETVIDETLISMQGFAGETTEPLTVEFQPRCFVDPRPSSFLQTHRGVPLCALIGVSLR